MHVGAGWWSDHKQENIVTIYAAQGADDKAFPDSALADTKFSLQVHLKLAELDMPCYDMNAMPSYEKCYFWNTCVAFFVIDNSHQVSISIARCPQSWQWCAVCTWRPSGNSHSACSNGKGDALRHSNTHFQVEINGECHLWIIRDLWAGLLWCIESIPGCLWTMHSVLFTVIMKERSLSYYLKTGVLQLLGLWHDLHLHFYFR